MRDEDLRDQLNAWIRPVREVPVPDIAVIRRRLRRRRTRTLTAAAALIVMLAASSLYARAAVSSSPHLTPPAATSTPRLTSPAVTPHATISPRHSPSPAVTPSVVISPRHSSSPARTLPASTSPPPSPAGTTSPPHPASSPPSASAPSHCAESNLRARWSTVTDDTMPGTVYKLVLRNAGSASCTIEGYPLMSITSPPKLKSVTFVYSPTSAAWPTINRAQINLKPGASAEVNILAGETATSDYCAQPAWAVVLPGGHQSFSPQSSSGSPTVCASGSVGVSPVYQVTTPPA